MKKAHLAGLCDAIGLELKSDFEVFDVDHINIMYNLQVKLTL